MVFHNGSKFDYHFIINELAKGVDGMTWLGEDMEKYISFSVSVMKTNNNGKLTIIKLRFVDSLRFTIASLGNLVDNLSELNKQECIKLKKEKTNQ